jgi:hypothetical protein
MDARLGIAAAFFAAFLIRCYPLPSSSTVPLPSANVQYSFGKALQKLASQELPMLSFASIASYLSNSKWLLGIAGDVSGGALTLIALAHAPISMVQPIMCSGMAMSALIAVYYLHEAIAPSDWLSTFLILLGRHSPPPPPHANVFPPLYPFSILVAISHTDHAEQQPAISVSGLFIVCCSIAAFVGVLLSRRRLLQHVSPFLAIFDAPIPASAIRCRSCSSRLALAGHLLFLAPLSEHHFDDSAGEFFFGGAAGCTFAASSFIVRAATSAPGALRALATLLGLCLSVFGVLLQGRGLRDGRSIVIIAWTNAVATMIAMIAGHLILLEALPTRPVDIALRASATLLILAGVAASALRLEPPTVLTHAVYLYPQHPPIAAPSFKQSSSSAAAGSHLSRLLHISCCCPQAESEGAIAAAAFVLPQPPALPAHRSRTSTRFQAAPTLSFQADIDAVSRAGSAGVHVHGAL